MLTVNHFEIIRRKVLLDGHSQREVAKELGHSRKTVAKAVEHSSPPGYRMGKARACPVMDPFRAVIEQWMESDKTVPPKQRHRRSGCMSGCAKSSSSREMKGRFGGSSPSSRRSGRRRHTGGSPMGGRKWVRRSLRHLSEDLGTQKHRACPNTVRRLLHKQDFALRANVKRLSGKPNPDRDRQFQHIQMQREAFTAAGLPVLSLDSKKKELIGNFKNAGVAWGQQARGGQHLRFPVRRRVSGLDPGHS